MIAVDAMGGDFAPRSAVQGALQAAKKNIKVGLYGDQVQLFSLLYECDINWQQLPIEVIHCSQVITMTDSATAGIIKKKDASLVRALHDVVDGKAQAVVSAGNSGAALVGGTLLFGRIPGIDRAAIGNFIPSITKSSTFCIDLGANVDCKPEQLVQFAIMGHIYTKMMHHLTAPRVGLLSNGQEPYKGSQLVKTTYGLLEQTMGLNFVGNIEPVELFKGRVDVLVSDGFSGNIMLKTAEGAYATFKDMLNDRVVSSSWFSSIMRFFTQKLCAHVRSKFDYERHGGALLLGVNYPLIVAHGCSNEDMIAHAIVFAHKKVKANFVERFAHNVAEFLNKQSHADSIMPVKKLHSMIEFDKNV